MDSEKRVGMKILHIIDSGGLYGAEVMLLQLMCEQKKLGHTPILASIGSKTVTEKPIESEARKQGLQIKSFRMANGLNIIGALKILRFAQEKGVELLHSHGYKGNILLGLLPRGIRRLPLLITVHGWTSTGHLNKMSLYEWLDKKCLARADHVVMVNPLMQKLPSLKRLKTTTVIENGIGLAKTEDQELNLEIITFIKQRTTLVAVGRFSPEKGFNYLLDSLSQLVQQGQDIQLLLLGDGGLRQELTEQAKTLGLLNRVFMPGHVSQVESYLGQCAVFVMPSLTEGLPIALLEAMQTGIPIVASAVGGIPDVLDDGQAGALVPAADPELLANALVTILTDSKYAETLGKRGQLRVKENYSSHTMAEKYLHLYAQLIGHQSVATTVIPKDNHTW